MITRKNNAEVRFRGFRTDGKGWAWGYPLIEGMNAYISYMDKDGNTHKFSVHADSISQYIGYQDAKYKDLYEGDKVLLNVAETSVPYIVDYNPYSMQYGLMGNGFKEFLPLSEIADRDDAAVTIMLQAYETGDWKSRWANNVKEKEYHGKRDGKFQGKRQKP